MKHLLLTTIAAVVLVGCGYSIHDAAMDGNIRAVKQHLDAGIDVNAKTETGWTPLHHAAYWGHTKIVKLLIAEGADVNARTKGGVTPVDRADKSAESGIVELLRQHGGKSGRELKAEGK